MAIQKNTTHLLKELGLSFTTVINSTIDLFKDPASLGIFIYLQSKPANWIIREKDIMARFGKGRDFVRARLKELRDVGLLVSKSSRSDSGKIIGWTTILYSHTEAQRKNKPANTKEESIDEEQQEEKQIKPATKQVKQAKQPEKKGAKKPQSPVTQKTEATTLLGNPTHINKRITSLEKKETTTTVVVVSEELDKELMQLREENMPNDERDPQEFIAQCKWHLDKGDAKQYNFTQRLAGLKKLIRQKRFETPASYPSKKTITPVSEQVIINQYKNYYHSWVEQDLRSKGYESMSFEQWKKRA